VPEIAVPSAEPLAGDNGGLAVVRGPTDEGAAVVLAPTNEEPLRRSEGFHFAGSNDDPAQMGPRPVRADPRTALKTTTAITAPITATTIVVMLIPVT
jgi:hypothetical protein